MDVRVPRIRVRMRAGVSTLRGQRFVCNIDEWPRGSSAPKGHYVRTIGPIGTYVDRHVLRDASD
jgi:exoribonuclease R